LKRNKDRWDEKVIKLPVNDLMICFDGAFMGIEAVIEKRLKKENKLPPQKYPNVNYLMQFLTKDDMIEYGILPELLSRIGKISLMNPLSVDTLYEILSNGKENDISIHKLYCEQRGFSLEFTNDALHEIAQLAYHSDLGVRSIGAILNTIMEDVYFDSSSYKGCKLTVDLPFIEKRLFYDKYNKLIEDFEHGIDIKVLSKKYGFDESEIYELIITHKTY
jgi:ATP-dependent Clp protease ATP-binding subunit ClpX